MRLAKVEIRRNELTTHAVTVPFWEVPLLQAVHGRDDVEVVGEDYDDRLYPEPETEYDRLMTRYGKLPDSDEAFMSRVYGAYELGIIKLQERIDEVEATEQVRAGVSSEPEEPPFDVTESAAAEPPKAKQTKARQRKRA